MSFIGHVFIPYGGLLMKYCQHCGQEIHDEAVVCVHCGRSCDSVNESANIKAEDKQSAGLNIVSFFIPIVGLILYCLNMKEFPIKAKGIGRAALIGFTVNLILICF